MLKSLRSLLAVVTIAASLTGCATTADDKHGAPDNVAPVVDAIPDRAVADIQKIADLERQLLKEQRQCYAEKRRLDLSLKEAQKQNEELQKKLEDLQKKLDALLDIDRDLRSRKRVR